MVYTYVSADAKVCHLVSVQTDSFELSHFYCQRSNCVKYQNSHDSFSWSATCLWSCPGSVSMYCVFGQFWFIFIPYEISTRRFGSEKIYTNNTRTHKLAAACCFYFPGGRKKNVLKFCAVKPLKNFSLYQDQNSQASNWKLKL